MTKNIKKDVLSLLERLSNESYFNFNHNYGGNNYDLLKENYIKTLVIEFGFPIYMAKKVIRDFEIGSNDVIETIDLFCPYSEELNPEDTKKIIEDFITSGDLRKSFKKFGYDLLTLDLKYENAVNKKILEIEEQKRTNKNIYNKDYGRNKNIAGLLAIFLGGFGIHKFYLGDWWHGIIYILFVWTFIPSIIAFIEGIIYFLITQESFDKKYNIEKISI